MFRLLPEIFESRLYTRTKESGVCGDDESQAEERFLAALEMTVKEGEEKIKEKKRGTTWAAPRGNIWLDRG